LTTGQSATSDVSVDVGPRWWERTIRALVPIALIGAILAHLLPFFNPTTGPIKIDIGLVAFFAGFLVLRAAPLDPYVEAFMLPLISAVVGLFLLSVRGRLGSLGPLVSALVGFTALGSGYFMGPQSGLAFGYYTAEGFFLIAAIAAAARLGLVRRNTAVSSRPSPLA
jgi:hypothetical protein